MPSITLCMHMHEAAECGIAQKHLKGYNGSCAYPSISHRTSRNCPTGPSEPIHCLPRSEERPADPSGCATSYFECRRIPRLSTGCRSPDARPPALGEGRATRAEHRVSGRKKQLNGSTQGDGAVRRKEWTRAFRVSRGRAHGFSASTGNSSSSRHPRGDPRLCG